MAALVPELSVADIAVSLGFYCELVGFAVRYQRVDEGFAFLAMGKAELMLDQSGVGRDWVTGPLDFPRGRGVNFQIEVPHLAPILSRLAAARLPLFQAVETKTYRTGGSSVTQTQCCVQDPDGYLLRLVETAQA
jgi:catechol 2,3-dioxygenase-like lactoylglutathione lyase family enzyme